MAGKGSRFAQMGYTFPKPLIDVNGKPMIQVVVENIGLKGHYIFLVLKEHHEKFALKYLLPLIVAPNPCTIITVDQVTEGAACTALLAKDYINSSEPLLMANSDQWVAWSPNHFIDYMNNSQADGGILTFVATHEKWSFVRLEDESNKILEVAEKKPISNIATTGIYFFSHGSDFVLAAEQMIKKNLRVNNEFYVAPSYNELILDNKKILSYPVAEMKGLGTPEDLTKFLGQ